MKDRKTKETYTTEGQERPEDSSANVEAYLVERKSMQELAERTAFLNQ